MANIISAGYYNKQHVMGGSESKNDDFSSKANFNINAHRQAMQHLGSNYVEPDLSMPLPGNSSANIRVEQTEFKKVTRSCSIYKPSFSIHVAQDSLLLEFEYECNQSSLLEVYVGVVNVEQHPSTEATTTIDSKLFFSEEVGAEKKQKYRREFPLNGYTGAENATLILRLMSLDLREKSEYSLRKVRQPSEHWKVLLEKLELNGVVTQLSNIFKGDASNECIICLTSSSDTLI